MHRVKFILLMGLTFIVTGFFSCNTVDTSTPQAPTDLVAKFLGTWHVSEKSTALNYDVTIARHKILPKTKVYLYNFADLGGRIDGEVVGNTILIHNAPTGTQGYTIDDATGTWVNAARIDFLYTLNDGVDKKVHEAAFTK